MIEFIDTYITPVIIFGFILSLPVLYNYRNKNAKSKWREVAQKHGWELLHYGDDFHFKYHPFKMEASYLDSVITVEWMPVTSKNPLVIASGRHTKNITKIFTPIKTKEQFSIVRKTYLHNIEKIMDAENWQDVEIGNRIYDDHFIIKTSNPEWLKKHINLDFIEHHLKYPFQVILSEGELSITHPDIEKKEEILVSSVQLLKDWVSVFKENKIV